MLDNYTRMSKVCGTSPSNIGTSDAGVGLGDPHETYFVYARTLARAIELWQL